MLGSELCEEDLNYLLSVVKEFVVHLWEVRKLGIMVPSLTPRNGMSSIAEPFQ